MLVPWSIDRMGEEIIQGESLAAVEHSSDLADARALLQAMGSVVMAEKDALSAEGTLSDEERLRSRKIMRTALVLIEHVHGAAEVARSAPAGEDAGEAADELRDAVRQARRLLGRSGASQFQDVVADAAGEDSATGEAVRALKRVGSLAHRRGRLIVAEECYTKALALLGAPIAERPPTNLEPSRAAEIAELMHLLGACHAQRACGEDLRCEGWEGGPDDVGQPEFDEENLDAALSLLRRSLAMLAPSDPARARVLNSLGVALLRVRRTVAAAGGSRALCREDAHGEAAAVLREALALSPEIWAAQWNLVRVLRSLRDAAVAGGREADAAALDAEVRSTLESMRHLPSEHIAACFDHYAGRFEEHLVGALGYRGPDEIEEAIRSWLPTDLPIRRCGDLGCGTGLMGPRLRALGAQRIEGVDLSHKMLLRACEKGPVGTGYDHLLCGDLLGIFAPRIVEASPAEVEASPKVEHLSQDIALDVPSPAEGDQLFELLVAADVLNYISDLGPTLAASSKWLAPRGLLVFTTEKPAEAEGAVSSGFAMTESCRFQHAESYVRETATACCLRVLACRAFTLRFNKGHAVDSQLFVLGRSADG